jgi:flagellar basal-body rod modification protein FlgD
MFLKLLVAQMKYQDPMNPTDSSQFLSQTAQFTSLEKMTTLADQMSSLLQSQMAFGASGMIGKSVTYTDDQGLPQTGTVTGASFLSTGPTLTIDGTSVPLTSLTSVGDTTTTAA